jgi:nucleoside-diphosphate-sugar epimerase
MKTLVTGAAGFIGSHLSKRLLDEGRDVILVDDFSRGDVQNLIDLGVNVECKKVDLKNYNEIIKLLKGVDVVYHLAALVGSIEYLHHNEFSELNALQENLLIDINVFKACLLNNVKTLIYTSSVSVYPMDIQNKKNVILSETDLNHINPEGGYGWAKLLGELQLKWMTNTNVGIARPFNVYGENEELLARPHVVPALIRKAIRFPKEEFIVWGNGEQSRCLLYVSDAVDALIRLEQVASTPPVIVNIGSDEETSIGELANKILRLSGKSINIKFDETKPVGPLSRTAEITKTKQILNWRPKVSLDEGLMKTYLWAKKRLES